MHRSKRRRIDEPDHRHCRLLRARSERPRGCRTAEERDERAPLHGAHPKARGHGASIAGQASASQQKAATCVRLGSQKRRTSVSNAERKLGLRHDLVDRGGPGVEASAFGAQVENRLGLLSSPSQRIT